LIDIYVIELECILNGLPWRRVALPSAPSYTKFGSSVSNGVNRYIHEKFRPRALCLDARCS